MSSFAETIYRNKYAQPGENWEDTARRVVETVMNPYFPEDVNKLVKYVSDRKFLPGGRYLYATGKPFHQTQNCLLLTVEDSRESISHLMERVSSGLMTGAGIGIVWSKLRPNGAKVKGMGGTSTGPIAFMQAVNEIGRNIMQGGSRRSAIWAGLHWNHADVFDFMKIKDWSEDIRAMKEKDFNAYAPLDMTNISVILDDEFFEAFEDLENSQHEWAQRVYWTAVESMLKTGEPGFSIDIKENAGENLRNAPVTASTRVLTDSGYEEVGNLVDTPATVWTGKQWARNVVFTKTVENADIVKVSMTGGRVIRCEPSHEFLVERYSGKGVRRKLISIDKVKAGDLFKGDILHVSMPDVPVRERLSSAYSLGWLFGDGSFRQLVGGTSAELTLCSDESKVCLPYISGYDTITENDSRGYTRVYWNSSEEFHGCTKEKAPQLAPGDVPSFIAGVFDADGNWESEQKRIRLASKHWTFLRDIARMLESMGILAHISKAGISTHGQAQGYQLVVASEYSDKFVELIPTIRIQPELNGYKSYRASTIKVLEVAPDGIEDVYCADVRVEEHSFMTEGVIISNCTEITSRDDNDICNLGSINLARVESLEEMRELTELATRFLICGTLYSKVPYQGVADTREKNRRLGLGLMGIYEWLVMRQKPYAPDTELEKYLMEYSYSGDYARAAASILGISTPVKTRALAPTGTIGIIAETTTSIEPLFASAYKRRYLKGDKWYFQYVVEPLAKRLADQGIDPDSLETAYTLALDPGRRLAFQTWVQQYVDHGISSTLNLPSWDSQMYSAEDFGSILLDHIKNLRGVTVYPDGSRGGQPLTVVSYAEAIKSEGVEYEELSNSQACVSGVCGA
jgi:ribonucleotide reductase alpha subunit